jgi:enoyl-CoA hydratase
MQNVRFQRRDRAGIVTLSRPERLNAVTPALVEELHTVLDQLMVHTQTWLVVLTGAGRGFCAGMDLQGGDPASAESSEGRMQRVFPGICRGGEVVARLRAGGVCGSRLCLERGTPP